MQNEEYMVKYWADEDTSEQGISEIEGSYTDKDEAIRNAKRLVNKG